MPNQSTVSRPKIEQPIGVDYRLIPLTHGFVAMVDAHAYEFLNQWRWYVLDPNRSRYARTWISGTKRQMSMHELLIPCPRGLFIDHIDRDKLNNRSSNLRLATRTENNRNTLKSRNASGFRGVYFHKETSKWVASITHNKKQNHLGLFHSPMEAARVRDRVARELHGEFAVLNFPLEVSR